MCQNEIFDKVACQRYDKKNNNFINRENDFWIKLPKTAIVKNIVETSCPDLSRSYGSF